LLRFKLAGHVGNAIEPHAKLPEAPFAPASYANDEKRKANENLWKSLLAQAAHEWGKATNSTKP
jgi:hypothetical protein